MAHNVTWYGWRPDLPDQRDFVYAASKTVIKKLPVKIDLRPGCPPVYDQGELGSCTANAIGAAFEYELMKQNKTADFMPSRLFIYYNERVMENTVNLDNGAEIRDGVKSINTQGVCPENLLPYDITKFAVQPTAACYGEALKHQVLSYHRVQRTLDDMRGCLSEGYPFVFGFTVYDAFESPAVAKSGKLDLPKKTEKVVGGHAVMAVGYDDKTKRFTVRNSWGSDWGLAGYFTMPYSYLTDGNLSDDVWTIRIVEV